MSNITRIADLPATNNGENLQNVMVKEQPTNYVPINVHPNPYGISEKNPITQEPPTSSHQDPQQGYPQQGYQQQGYPQQGHQQQGHPPQEIDFRQVIAEQELPSRDIPMDSTQYTQDPGVKANYIPEAKSDYLKNYEIEERKNMKYEQETHRKKMLDVIMDEIQLAVFVGLLFFIFQTSFFRKMIWNNFSWMPILNSDGNMNGYGVLFKSALFGMMFYMSQKAADFLLDL